MYEDFFLHTYPCIYMNLRAFTKCISKFKYVWDTNLLFNAADVCKRNFLTFKEYLLLIAIMEPYTSHYGTLGEIRCQYIFR